MTEERKPSWTSYIEGADRNDVDGRLVSHLYEGTFSEPGNPFCARGWNRENGHGYSIFRGNTGARGTCLVCMRRVREGREPVPPRDRPTRWL